MRGRRSARRGARRLGAKLRASARLRAAAGGVRAAVPHRAAAAASPLLVLLAVLATPGSAAGQDASADPFPEWARHWRPLAPVAEIPREFPDAPSGADLVLAPAERIGHFWTVGNPAALRWEIEESWTAFAIDRDARSGGYRRPLDPEERDLDRLRALSWTRLGGRGAAAGELEAGRDLRGPSSFADFFEPHRGTPFVVTDSGSFDMRNIFARLEGALGVSLGEWGLGVAAGFEANEDRTRESPFVRFGTQTEFAATGGVLRRLADGRFQVGAHLRGRGSAEDWALTPVGETGVAHLTQGLAEPERVPILTSPLLRRIETHGVAGGVSVGGLAGAFGWVVFGEVAYGEERQTGRRQAQADDPMDRWTRDAVRIGGAIQRRLGRRLVAGVEGEWVTLDGEATIPDLEEPVFLVEQSRVSAAGELRLRPPAERSGWGAALRFGIRAVPWEQVDRLVELSSDLEITRPEISASLARQFGSSVTLAGSYGIAFHDASGSLPDPDEQGPAYRRLIAPELALYAASATPQAVSGLLRWQTSDRVDLWLYGRFGTVSPAEADRDLQALPGGDRDGYGVAAGVVLDAP